MPKPRFCDFTTVTPDHVDARSTIAPALDRTVLDAKVDQTRKLDRVLVPLRTDVADVQDSQDHVSCRARERASVVDVDAVDRRPGDREMTQLDVLGIDEVNPGRAATDNGSGRRSLTSDDDRLPLLAREPADANSPAVFARSDEDLRTGLRVLESVDEGVAVPHADDVFRRCTESDDRKEHDQRSKEGLGHVFEKRLW